jgi:hypothetical protein
MPFVRCNRTNCPHSVTQARTLGERFMHEKDDRTEMTAIDARGARLGRPVLVVLIVSALAVIGIFSLLYYGTYG